MTTKNFAHGIASQMLAALSTLKDCIDRCPETEWNETHNDHPFSQIVFHVLFDCDLKLSGSIAELKAQSFHDSHRQVFADYEELGENERTHLYARDFINEYYRFCLDKIKTVVESKSDEELLTPNGDVFSNMTKGERYINTIRHIQHHAAQLGLKIQYFSQQEMNWISRGYEANL